MNWSNSSFHLLKYESVRSNQNQCEQQSQKTTPNNISFSIPQKQEQLYEKIRCKSVICDEFGNYSNKQKIFHDLVVEFPQHKKQRLTEIIVQNLKKNPITYQQNSFRNIVVKQQRSSNITISSFNKRLKDIRKYEQELNLDSKAGIDFHSKNLQKLKYKLPKVEVDPSIDTMHTGIFSCSPGESPRVKILKKTSNKFILKQTLQKANIIDKIIVDSKINSKTTFSPRQIQLIFIISSIMHHQHKKTKSSGNSAYSEQNQLLRRFILNQQKLYFIKILIISVFLSIQKIKTNKNELFNFNFIVQFSILIKILNKKIVKQNIFQEECIYQIQNKIKYKYPKKTKVGSLIQTFEQKLYYFLKLLIREPISKYIGVQLKGRMQSKHHKIYLFNHLILEIMFLCIRLLRIVQSVFGDYVIKKIYDYRHQFFQLKLDSYLCRRTRFRV